MHLHLCWSTFGNTWMKTLGIAEVFASLASHRFLFSSCVYHNFQNGKFETKQMTLPASHLFLGQAANSRCELRFSGKTVRKCSGYQSSFCLGLSAGWQISQDPDKNIWSGFTSAVKQRGSLECTFFSYRFQNIFWNIPAFATNFTVWPKCLKNEDYQIVVGPEKKRGNSPFSFVLNQRVHAKRLWKMEKIYARAGKHTLVFACFRGDWSDLKPRHPRSIL